MHDGEDISFKNLFLPLTAKKAVIFLFIFGIIVYFNSLFNAFVFDDNFEIVRNPLIRSLYNLPYLFSNQTGGLEITGYYRPITFIFYALIFSVSQLNPFLYHFVQVLLVIINSILVFLILKKYINHNLSFFLSLIFLIHPVNAEVAEYIADLPDVLFLFFGLSALYLLQKNGKKISALLLSSLCLLFSLLSKETGFLFFIFAFLFVFLFEKKKLLYQGIFSSLMLLIYAVLRYFSHVPLKKTSEILLHSQTFQERLLNIPSVILYYFKILVFPVNLAVYNTWIVSYPSFSSFYFPLILDFVILLLISLLLLRILKKNAFRKKIALFFFFWLLASLALHSQVILLDSTVAQRYFYLPFVGLLGLAGLFLDSLPRKKVFINAGIALISVIILVLSILTVSRNTDWQSQSLLLEREEKFSQNDSIQELLYGNDLYKNKKFKEAEFHIKKSLKINPLSSQGWNSLGAVYYSKGEIKNAEKAYLKALSLNNYYGTYENLGFLYKQYEKPSLALSFLKKATKFYPESEKLWYYRFIVGYKMGDQADALLSSKYYYLLKRDSLSYSIYEHVLNKKPISIK